MNDAGSTHEGELHAFGLTAPARRAKPKALFRGFVALGLLGLALGLAGCSTPGPSHAYLYSPALGPTIRDINPLDGAESSNVVAFVDGGEQVLGLAYEPYTDHLYIRIFPGNRIRVIDRPAGKVKREIHVPSLPLGGHDFAIRSVDRHFFFTDPTAPALIEVDLAGNLEGYIKLEGLDQPVWGVAHDQVSGELLILASETTDRIRRHGTDGALRSELKLERAVRGLSLAYDPVERLSFASLDDGSAIGVFDDRGRLVRSLPRPDPSRETFIGIGPRSLLRLF